MPDRERGPGHADATSCGRLVLDPERRREARRARPRLRRALPLPQAVGSFMDAHYRRAWGLPGPTGSPAVASDDRR